ncbi:MAG: glycogen debranching protein GlgX [Candidatus Promineifilaceae bacterium]|jgi:glycogen operon protein
MQRIDVYPTHEYRGYGIRPGRPYPFGATDVPNGVNFSIFSKHADYCVLVLFEKGAAEPFVEIPFRGLFDKPDRGEAVWANFRIGNVFCMTVFNLDHENLEYGFRMDGPFEKVEKGQPGIHRFDRRNILLDPYARGIGGREVWGETPEWNDAYHHRARLVLDDFDWESDRALEIPLEDLVIYEMHVRSFTRHDSSGIKHPGTFTGVREKIPYLKELGVNCIELMPIYEFDEFENSKANPITGELNMNYWGYSTVGFFSPKAGYAATGKAGDATMVSDELKTLVKECHQNGIEVMLDVVFNHTAEGNEYGPTISFRGIDNATYYMLTPEGYYYNFSGTGNTLNCNNPIVRNIVLDCLRYWAAEYHIDGFRFDLASILGRDPWGTPLANPPLLEALANDPVLAKVKLVAEAWDAGGLYQVGSFPAYGRWAEWNGKYRDDARKFLKGDSGLVGAIAQRIQGSPDLYSSRGPTASINFITCHDGFTLMDTFSYDGKHNEANGEDNRDGANDNHSWNHGWEGPTADEGITELRHRQIKNAITLLMVSQGVPMILMGDELGRTKQGNNNTYCHDNELNWLDWSLLEQNPDLHRYVQRMIAFRHAHPVLRGRYHLRNQDYVGSGFADITWHGTQPWYADWSADSHLLAFMLCGKHAKGGEETDDYIYVALNSDWAGQEVGLPSPPEGMKWHVFSNTGAAYPEEIWDVGQEPALENQQSVWLDGRSTIVLVGR